MKGGRQVWEGLHADCVGMGEEELELWGGRSIFSIITDLPNHMITLCLQCQERPMFCNPWRERDLWLVYIVWPIPILLPLQYNIPPTQSRISLYQNHTLFFLLHTLVQSCSLFSFYLIIDYQFWVKQSNGLGQKN